MIPLCKPDIRFENVSSQIKDILESGQLTQGKQVQVFEELVASYVGVEHAIAVSSATTGLHLCLSVLNIGAGDEVLISDFTFPATGNVVHQVGAIPVLIDCEKGSFLLDLDEIEKKITPKVKAIMVVDPFGQPVKIDQLKKLSKKYSIPIIEDAACAIGAQRGKENCGAWADLSVFSFHPRKVITTGEGGMILTNNHEYHEKARLLLSHGSVSMKHERKFVAKGFNYRLPEISAVLGIEQILRLDQILHDRRLIAREYLAKLSDLEEVSIFLAANIDECTFQSFVIIINDQLNRDTLIQYMKDHGIESTLGTYALHAQPAFEDYGYKPNQLPNSYFAYRQSLTLPLYADMPTETIDYVVNTLKAGIRAQQ